MFTKEVATYHAQHYAMCIPLNGLLCVLLNTKWVGHFSLSSKETESQRHGFSNCALHMQFHNANYDKLCRHYASQTNLPVIPKAYAMECVRASPDAWHCGKLSHCGNREQTLTQQHRVSCTTEQQHRQRQCSQWIATCTIVHAQDNNIVAHAQGNDIA